MRDDIIEKKEEIIKMISESEPKSRICMFLNCKTETLNFYLKSFGVDYRGNPGLKGKKRTSNETSYKEYTENGAQISSHKLKNKLIKQGVKEEKCEICERVIWNGVIIPLELHHINGNHFDNHIENLQILCPNCHAQQKGNSGSNIGVKIQNELPKINEVLILVEKVKIERIKKEKIIKQYFCSACGIEMKGKSKTGKCLNCIKKESRRVVWPNKDELLKLILNNSFIDLSKKFGVSDKTITKWCKHYNLPHKRKDINKLLS